MSDGLELEKIKELLRTTQIMVDSMLMRIERLERARGFTMSYLTSALQDSKTYEIFRARIEPFLEFNSETINLYTTKFDDERITEDDYDEQQDIFEDKYSENGKLIEKVLSDRSARLVSDDERSVSELKTIYNTQPIKINDGGGNKKKRTKTKRNKRHK